MRSVLRCILTRCLLSSFLYLLLTWGQSEIPEKWRAKALSAVRMPTDEDDGISSCYFREQDFCYIEDDATQNGQYIDLTLNPERFTGYAGPSAHHVWQAIYEENCFGLSEAAMDASKASKSPGAGRLASSNAGARSHGVGFNKLNEGWGTEMVRGGLKADETCEEKKVYYRVISGESPLVRYRSTCSRG